MVMDILILSECKACYAVVIYMHDGWNIMFLGFDSVYDIGVFMIILVSCVCWCCICLMAVDLSCRCCDIYW